MDINSALVDQAGKAGLDVRQSEAVEHLRTVPDGSLSAVTAFHLVEHMSSTALIELVDSAMRVLRRGVCRSWRLPNPLNLKVGAASFHLDPTHLRPIHRRFLEFVLENRGFAEIRTVVVNPPGRADASGCRLCQGDGGAVNRMVQLLNEACFVAVIARRADPEGEKAGSIEELPVPPAAAPDDTLAPGGG